MLEVYHFVTPLSTESIVSEKKVTDYFKQMKKFVSYRMIPVVTMQSVRNTYHELKNDYHIDMDYTTVATSISQLALDTKAIQSQGRKAARMFFLNMQEQLLANIPYSKDLVLATISKLNLDVNLFLEDYNTSLTLSSLKDDQNMATEMSVVRYPTMVVYNSSQGNYALQTADFTEKNLTTIFNQSEQHSVNSKLHLIDYEEGSN